MPLFDHVLDIARRQLRRVVLPESSDERILRAAFEVHRQGIASPVLLGDAQTIGHLADTLGIDLSGIATVTPASHERHEHYINALIEKRKHRGMTQQRAATALNDTVAYACMMVSEGDADACVAGAITSTAKVVSNARRYVGKHEDASIVSSCFIMLLKPEHPVADAIVIGDCALVIEPDTEELAAIAVATGESACQFLNLQPQVAMLSFSTAGSARHASVSKVARATALVRQQRPHWRVVGEVQLDAAVIPAVLASKAPEQASSEPCNVLIFPNLDAGNIGYKLIERFGNAQAIGPILQGLAQPVNDLSRGVQCRGYCQDHCHQRSSGANPDVRRRLGVCAATGKTLPDAANAIAQYATLAQLTHVAMPYALASSLRISCKQQLSTSIPAGMVDKRKIGGLYLVLLWVLISILAWPAYVLCSTLLAIHGAEGWQLEAWHMMPRPFLFEQFILDYKASAIIAIPIGLVAVIDYLLLSRYKATWLLGGIFLPLAATAIAFGFYRQPYAALPSLLATGILLAIVHRLIDIAAGSESRGRLR